MWIAGMHLRGLVGLPSGQPSTKRREEVTAMPIKHFDDDTMERAIEAWKQAFSALRQVTQSVFEIMKSLYDAVVKAQRVRRLNRAHRRKPKTLGVVPVTYLYIRPHAAYVRFHVAATGD